MDKPLYVTRPYLPPLAEVLPSLESIWERRVLTNAGPYHQEFERELASFLGVPHISLVTNGTVALSLALEALDIQGEVITTPFSFVATSHALMMRGVEPVFADLAYGSVNIDPVQVEKAITDRTTAIMPVHCYGIPCDVNGLETVARNHHLHLIYDAAHAFGVGGRDDILNRGDMSTLSFHATKAFNTFEGGAIISSNAERKGAIDRLRNFGFRDELCVDALGANGKMSEFSAALGLVQLTHFEDIRRRRQEIDARYRSAFADVAGLTCLSYDGIDRPNYSYFPVFIGPEFRVTRDALYDELKSRNIHGRRYFYPLISNFAMYRGLPSSRPINLPNATRMANEVLCLPMYPDLDAADQDRIIGIVRGD
ncbi:MAG: DegT/DnrJ/EryC1/StrS family aminotransferase [Novosphingobium sp.]